MKFENKLNNLARSLDPSSAQKDRIKDSVFNNLNLETEDKTNLIDQIIMKKKLLISLSGFVAVAIFLGVPLIAIQTAKDHQGFELASLSEYRQESGTNLNPSSTGASGYDDNSFGRKVSDGVENVQDMIVEITSPSPEPWPVVQEDEDTETNESDRAKEKTGNLTLSVDELDTSISSIYELTESVNGYVISSNYSTTSKHDGGYITIRIPSDKFDFVMRELRGMASEVLTEYTNIVDLQNQLTSTNETLTELKLDLAAKQELLANEKVESVKRQLENEISYLKNQIDIQEMYKSEIEDKTSFSTISISLNQHEAEEVIDGSIKGTFDQAIDVSKTIVTFWVKVGLWALLIIPAAFAPVIGVLLAIRFVRKRKG